jgi:hypothetical protein
MTIGQEWAEEEDNQTIQWMMRLPRGKSLGGVDGEPETNSLGFEFLTVGGVGKVVPDPLGLGSTMVGVGADGLVRVAPPLASGWSEVKTTCVAETKLVGPTVMKELTPSDTPLNRPRSTNPYLGV